MVHSPLQAAVESAVSWERAALAAAAEIGALVQAAAGAEKAWAATEADSERRALEERRTRSSALEAAREVLGTIPSHSVHPDRGGFFWGAFPLVLVPPRKLV